LRRERREKRQPLDGGPGGRVPLAGGRGQRPRVAGYCSLERCLQAWLLCEKRRAFWEMCAIMGKEVAPAVREHPGAWPR